MTGQERDKRLRGLPVRLLRDESPGRLPLVGVREIALLADVSSQAVVNWRTRYSDFPEPVAELSNGPVYWQPDVEAWLSRRALRSE